MKTTPLVTVASVGDGPEPPEHILCLYKRPQSEWGAEDWKVLAIYLADELTRANSLARDARALTERALRMVQPSLHADARAGAALKAIHRIEAGVLSGHIKILRGNGRSPRKAGRPKVSDFESQASIVLAAHKEGPANFARRMAEHEARQTLGGRINRTIFERSFRSWKSKISRARREVRRQLESTPGGDELKE